ncbi:PP2C family protein-serine/threonine phosphatase [Nocardioides terrisoli]|uniref:PP2C family protein-serine/threonine phosphatase n=1 Tax=Nocardioides terrisoli TaxID=3388267 RepID=UPI00287B6B7A|nr:PP2C family protein-serine/threonine phosphatase [Nocardioides marmorisolisilvae]
MTAISQPTTARRARGWWLQLRREVTYSDRLALGVLVLLAVAIVVVGLQWTEVVPYGAMVAPMFFGSLWLGPRKLPWFVVFCLLGVCVLLAAGGSIDTAGILRIVVTFGIGLVILVSSFRRLRLGVSGRRSESMFVDLRDRISKQGVLPGLPDEWYVESDTRSAGGTAFAGDFLVANPGMADECLALAVVDVSGKGVEAGTRALLLSGAFGGLLSALPPSEFLPAANTYLLHQDWDEGFATAIHLHIDTRTGDFELRKAGHPPGLWLQSGSGTWRVLESDGPVLGIIEAAEFEVVRGRLEHGDALLLYTDGLVETSRRDISSGIDRLAGQAQRLVRDGFEGGARRLVSQLEAGNDDCALVLLHRR